jgi:hypothetical protein
MKSVISNLLTFAQTAQLVMIKSRLKCEKTEDNNDEYFALINLLQCLKFTGIHWNFLLLTSNGSRKKSFQLDWVWCLQQTY